MIKNDSGRKRWSTSALIIGVFLFLVFFTQGTAFAWPWSQNAGSAETVAFLQNHSRWLDQSGLLASIFHSIAWLIVRGLYTLSSFLEGLLVGSLDLLGWLDMSAMDGLVGGIVRGLVVVLMTLTLVWIGIKLIVSKNPIQMKSVVVNVLLSAILIIGMPTLLGTLTNLTLTFVGDTVSAGEDIEGSLSWHIVRDNTADLVYVAHHGFELIANDNAGATRNALTPEQLNSIDLTSVLTPRDIDRMDSAVPGVEHLRYHLIDDGLGNLRAVRFGGGGLLGAVLPDNGYFRYPMNFWTIFLGLIGLIVAQIFALFTFITAIIEIGFKRVVGLFVFATDLESGQRTKLVVQDIFNAFLLIAFTFLGFRLYGLFIAFLGGATRNPLIYVIGMIAATFVLIRGSSTIMRYFGVESGGSGGLSQLVGMYAVYRAVTGFGRRGLSRRNPRDQGTDNNRQEDNEADNQSSDMPSNAAESPNNQFSRQNTGRSVETAAQRVPMTEAPLSGHERGQSIEIPFADVDYGGISSGKQETTRRESRKDKAFSADQEQGNAVDKAPPKDQSTERAPEIPHGDRRHDKSNPQKRGSTESVTERPISGQGQDTHISEPKPLMTPEPSKGVTPTPSTTEFRDNVPRSTLDTQPLDTPSVAEYVDSMGASPLPANRSTESDIVHSASNYTASKVLEAPLPPRQETMRNTSPMPSERPAAPLTTKRTSKQVMREQMGATKREPDITEKDSRLWKQRDADANETPWWRVRDADRGGKES